MVGSATYTDEEIVWILEGVLAKRRPQEILAGFRARFGRPLGPSQLRYVRTKYGKDPRFKIVADVEAIYSSPLINKPLKITVLHDANTHASSSLHPSSFPSTRSYPSPHARSDPPRTPPRQLQPCPSSQASSPLSIGFLTQPLGPPHRQRELHPAPEAGPSSPRRRLPRHREGIRDRSSQPAPRQHAYQLPPADPHEPATAYTETVGSPSPEKPGTDELATSSDHQRATRHSLQLTKQKGTQADHRTRLQAARAQKRPLYPYHPPLHSRNQSCGSQQDPGSKDARSNDTDNNTIPSMRKLRTPKVESQADLLSHMPYNQPFMNQVSHHQYTADPFSKSLPLDSISPHYQLSTFPLHDEGLPSASKFQTYPTSFDQSALQAAGLNAIAWQGQIASFTPTSILAAENTADGHPSLHQKPAAADTQLACRTEADSFEPDGFVTTGRGCKGFTDLLNEGNQFGLDSNLLASPNQGVDCLAWSNLASTPNMQTLPNLNQSPGDRNVMGFFSRGDYGSVIHHPAYDGSPESQRTIDSCPIVSPPPSCNMNPTPPVMIACESLSNVQYSPEVLSQQWIDTQYNEQLIDLGFPSDTPCIPAQKLWDSFPSMQPVSALSLPQKLPQTPCGSSHLREFSAKRSLRPESLLGQNVLSLQQDQNMQVEQSFAPPEDPSSWSRRRPYQHHRLAGWNQDAQAQAGQESKGEKTGGADLNRVAIFQMPPQDAIAEPTIGAALPSRTQGLPLQPWQNPWYVSSPPFTVQEQPAGWREHDAALLPYVNMLTPNEMLRYINFDIPDVEHRADDDVRCPVVEEDASVSNHVQNEELAANEIVHLLQTQAVEYPIEVEQTYPCEDAEYPAQPCDVLFHIPMSQLFTEDIFDQGLDCSNVKSPDGKA